MGLLSFLNKNAPWLAAGGLLTFLSSFGQTYFISLFAGEIRAEFGLSHGEWGGIYSLGTTASAIVMIWAGAQADVFRVRVLGPIVLIGLAISCMGMALNPVVWALPVIIFAQRIFGQGMMSHLAMVAMTRWFVATRGRALAIATMGFAIGQAVLPIIFVALLAIYDWHHLWILAAGICLVGLPVLMLLLKRERTPQSMAKSHSSTGMDGRQWTRRQSLMHPLFWFMFPALLGPAAFNTAFFFHQVHFAEIKGWSHGDLVAFFPLYTVASIIAMFGSGWALDKFGTVRLIPYYQLPMVICFLVFSATTGLMGMTVGFVLLAITAGANSTLPSAFWAEFYGTTHIGAIKAMSTAVMVLGSAIGPGITGYLIDFGVGLEQQFIGVSIYFLFASALMYIGVRRARPLLTC